MYTRGGSTHTLCMQFALSEHGGESELLECSDSGDSESESAPAYNSDAADDMSVAAGAAAAVAAAKVPTEANDNAACSAMEE